MRKQTEESSMIGLSEDHQHLAEEFGRRRDKFATLRLDLTFWIRSHGRIALMYIALIIGLTVLTTDNVLLKHANTNMSELITFVTFGVIFTVAWLGTSHDN